MQIGDNPSAVSWKRFGRVARPPARRRAAAILDAAEDLRAAHDGGRSPGSRRGGTGFALPDQHGRPVRLADRWPSGRSCCCSCGAAGARSAP